jgi:hypothetical protein
VKAKTNNSKKQVKSVVGHVKHGVKMAVVPHKKNGYRPHFVRIYGLGILVLAVLGMQLGYNGMKTGDVLGVESNITVTKLFNQTNDARRDAGLKPLNLNEKLNRAAFLKANDMLTDQYWSHTSPSGVEPWKWFADVGYNYDEAGENLAKGFSTAEAVNTAWLDSPEHKANIVNSRYEDVGFSVVSGQLMGKPTTLVVALYAEPADKSVAGEMSGSGASEIKQTDLLTRFAVALRSITPAMAVGLALITIGVVVSTFAHAYRHKLAKSFRQTWYRHHHGLLKALGLTAFAVTLIFFYSGGQI